MVKIRKGWYLVGEDDERKKSKDEREVQLGLKQAALTERCDNKIARRQLQTEQREILDQKKWLCAQRTVHLNRGEIELAHRLSAELSRRKNGKDCLETSQVKSLKRQDEDETFEKLQQAEMEKKKRHYRNDLQKQLIDNRRRIQEERTKQKDQDRKMMEQEMQKIQEENMNIKEKKNRNAILLKTELGAALAAKEIWQKKYKKAMKDEDERIIRIAAEKEAQQKKMIEKRMELRKMEDAAIDRIAKRLLDNSRKKEEYEEMCDELYQAEERNKWVKESEKNALRKQCSIIELLKEMEKQHKDIAEKKAKDAAIDVAFTQCLLKEQQKNIEKQRKHDEARRAKSKSILRYLYYFKLLFTVIFIIEFYIALVASKILLQTKMENN